MKDSIAPVFMCIGSSRIKGDNLGPTVGELLTKKHNIKTYVYGTEKRPLTAKNVISVYNFVKKNHNAKIFVIDASIGNETDCGMVSVYKGGLSPAAACKKALPCIGDYSLICNVSMFFNQATVSLMSARLLSVKEIAENIALGVNDALTLQRASSFNNFS